MRVPTDHRNDRLGPCASRLLPAADAVGVTLRSPRETFAGQHGEKVVEGFQLSHSPSRYRETMANELSRERVDPSTRRRRLVAELRVQMGVPPAPTLRDPRRWGGARTSGRSTRVASPPATTPGSVDRPITRGVFSEGRLNCCAGRGTCTPSRKRGRRGQFPDDPRHFKQQHD